MFSMPSSVIIPKRRRGIILVMALIFLAAISAASVIVYERTNSGTKSTSRRVNDQEAIRVAEAGIEKAVWCLNNPTNTTDCPGNPNYTGESSSSFGRGEYTITVTGSGSTKTIDSIGTIIGSGGTSERHLQIKLSMTTTNVAFSYGLQAGVGGLEMKNNNKIFGNVFSSGPVVGAKSAITGDAILTKGSPTPDAISDPDVSPLTTVSFGTNGATTDWLAQSFSPTVTDKIFSLDLKIAEVNDPSSTLQVYIYSDSSNNPGTDLTGGGVTISSGPDASVAGWENGWTTKVYAPATNPVLSAGQTYWLVIKTSGSNTTKFWRTAVDTDNTAYASGQAKLDGDSTTMLNACSGAGCDIAFRVNMGGVSSTLDVECTGALCIDGQYGIGGNAYAETIANTKIKQHACYQNITGTVETGQNTETCLTTSTAPVPCDNLNTTYGTGPYCHAGNTTLSPADFPISTAQISQMEAQAAAGGTTNCSSGCTISSGSIGPRKYSGDVTIDGPVTLTGTIWVVGNLYLNDTMTLSNAYGSQSGSIVADNAADPINSGRIIVGNGGNAIGNTQPSTYIMLLSMSQMLSDDNGAIDVSNNLTAGVVFAARGSVVLKNSADLKEVTGQRIVLQNGSEVTYETGLASTVFSGGPGGSWTYNRGTYQIID